MKARWIGSDIGNPESLRQSGDIAIGAENYHHNLLVQCPVCDSLHVVAINKGNHVGWQWNESTLTLSPSVKITGTNGVCHWQLIKGTFFIWQDSTAGFNCATRSAEENPDDSFARLSVSKGD